jgi:hypothetical protein
MQPGHFAARRPARLTQELLLQSTRFFKPVDGSSIRRNAEMGFQRRSR